MDILIKPMRILNTIGTVFSAEALDILNSCGSVDSVDISQKELLEKVGDYEIFFLGIGLHLDREVLDRATKLRVIATATTGLDHIDVEYAKQKGVQVISLRGEDKFLNSITATAELACGLMLSVARCIPSASDSVKNYHWEREQFRGHTVFGKTLGIVGLGRLGKMMARYGLALGMKVIAFDPYQNKNVFDEIGVAQVSFEQLIEQSDVVSVHVHLNSETENLFSQSVFEKMKPESYLINTSRGKIVNEADVLSALENKLIAGYATDVLADEIHFGKTFPSHPLVEYAKEHNNVIIVPHIGGMTYESREATDVFMAKKLKKYFEETM